MASDLYFDCPICGHTLKVEPHLVDQLVECPDCANEIRVPDIRDGLNPRFRWQESAEAAKAGADEAVRPDRKPELLPDLVVEQLESLWRRREEQTRQLEYIRFNAELCGKQIALLQKPSVPVGEASRTGDTVNEGTRTSLAWSIAFACLTLAASVALLLWV